MVLMIPCNSTCPPQQSKRPWIRFKDDVQQEDIGTMLQTMSDGPSSALAFSTSDDARMEAWR